MRSREALGGEVEQAQRRIQARDLVADRVQKVSFAEADAAVDEERVVRLRREFCDRLAGGLRELVRVAHHERGEGVARREAVGERHRRGFASGDRRSLGLAIDLDGDHRVAAQDGTRRRLERFGVVLHHPVATVLVGRRDANERSPSIAVTRHGRSQESMAVSGIFPSIVASRRVHKESSIVRPLVGGAVRSYTQSYPQVWITGGIPDDLGSGGATSADQVATSHQFRQTRDRRYTFSTARLVCVREATLP